MKGDPYTPAHMEARTGTQSGDNRFDGLHAEASAAVGYSANTLRGIRERYREAYSDALIHWQDLRDQLDRIDRSTRKAGKKPARSTESDRAASAAEAGADDALQRNLRAEVDQLSEQLGGHQGELAKLELAQSTLERTWLFMERGDVTLVNETGGPSTSGDIQMRIVEAQEAERARLAQEIHDGPAQVLSNSIFQVEYIERVLATDPKLADTELGILRELLRRELGNLRAFITQLRPPLLDELGLDGAIMETVENINALTGLSISTDLAAPSTALDDRARTVALRVAQEALQNVRKHASASHVTVSTSLDGDDWTLEVRDDGRGFDAGAVAARGRSNFGLQFMRERAELIGARLDIRSRPDGGTVVRLAIPIHDGAEQRESR
jgi:two-component system, NarL family, sensor histidine kinase DegS